MGERHHYARPALVMVARGPDEDCKKRGKLLPLIKWFDEKEARENFIRRV
jgi:hypothetical protein